MSSRYTPTETDVCEWLTQHGYNHSLSQAIKKCGEELAELAEAIGQNHQTGILVECGDVAVCLQQILMIKYECGLTYAMNVAHRKNLSRYTHDR